MPFKKRSRPLTMNLTNKQHLFKHKFKHTKRPNHSAHFQHVQGQHKLCYRQHFDRFALNRRVLYRGSVQILREGLISPVGCPQCRKRRFRHGSRFSKKEDMWESKFEGTSSFKDLKVYWVTFKRQLAFGFILTLLSKTPRQVEKVSPTYSRLPYDGESLNTILSVPFLLCVLK